MVFDLQAKLTNYDLPGPAVMFFFKEGLNNVEDLFAFDFEQSESFGQLPSEAQLQVMSLRFDLYREASEQGLLMKGSPGMGISDGNGNEPLLTLAEDSTLDGGDRQDVVKMALRGFQQQLLDLSARQGNQLLNFRETKLTVRIVDELPDETFDFLVRKGKSMTLLPLPEDDEEFNTGKAVPKGTVIGGIHTDNELPMPGDVKQEKHIDDDLQTPLFKGSLEGRLRRIKSSANTTIQESGVNLLHLAIGFVDWCKPEEPTKIRRAPLLLVPVEIVRDRLDRNAQTYEYSVHCTDEDIERCNLSLRELMAQDYDLVLPEFEEEDTPESYFKKVQPVVARQEGWRVSREMVIGFFSYTKFLMFRDLSPESWVGEGGIDANDIVKVLLGGKESEAREGPPERIDIDQDVRATKIPLVVDADSSQHEALVEALEGRNLVVHGPPGTGKSQTITNLIAAALEDGKTVLFVSEKMAALEVVRRNLDNVGLGDFCLELHSTKVQKRRLLADLHKRVESAYRAPDQIRWKMESLWKARDQLNHYADRMRQKIGPYEEPLWEVLGKADLYRVRLPERVQGMRIEAAASFKREDVEALVGLFGDMDDLLKDLPPAKVNPWRGFRPEQFIAGDTDNVRDIVVRLLGQIEKVNGIIAASVSGQGTPFLPILGTLKELGEADLGNLPAPPDRTVQALLAGSGGLDHGPVERLERLSSRFRELKQALAAISETFPELTGEQCDRAAQHLGRCQDLGMGRLLMSEVSGLGRTSSTLASRLLVLLEAAEALASILAVEKHDFSMLDCRSMLKVGDLILGLDPALRGAVKPWFCKPETQTALARMRESLGNLKSDEEAIAECLVLSSLPPAQELSEHASAWRANAGSAFSFLSSAMRRTKRAVATYVVGPEVLKRPDLHAQLQRAAEYVERRLGLDRSELFAESFGQLFQGVSTDVHLIERAVDWAHALSSSAGGPSRAMPLVERIGDLPHEISDMMTNLRETLREIDDLFASLPASFQLEESHLSSLSERLSLRKLAEVLSAAAVLSDDTSRWLPGVPYLADLSVEAGLQAIVLAGEIGGVREQADAMKSELAWLGKHFAGVETDSGIIRSTLEWGERVEQSKLTPNLKHWLKASDSKGRHAHLLHMASSVEEANGRISEALEGLRRYGSVDRRSFLTATEGTTSIEDVLRKLRSCIESSSNLVRWSHYCSTTKEASARGCGTLVNLIEEEVLPPAQGGSALLYCVYYERGRLGVTSDPYLRSFMRVTHERVQKEFGRLDREMMRLRRQQIAATIALRRVPMGCGTGKIKDFTEMSLIRRELSKKTRHVPVRQLVKRASRALMALKPCFMMSPLSVAQYLAPGRATFDLVVMDEASQIRPQDAIGAVARGTQLIVVGDEKQLPPTSFFDRMESHEDEEELTAAEQSESILDVAASCCRSRSLEWHYRSRHESLIDFSNQQFYDGRLVVFPSPAPGRSELGIRHHYVSGARYTGGRGRRVNLEEAQAVAEAAVKHMLENPEFTLGIATFNRPQMELIEDLVEKLQKSNPEALRAEERWKEVGFPFFVKNLENVQGDERDVIFISTTYGPDKDTGKVNQRFGPLAGEMGWRRLNVLVTRARHRVEVFTSMQSSDVQGGPEAPFGVRALKDYLEYAETGRHVDRGIPTGREPDSDFEVAVGDAITSLGYQVAYQVGVRGYRIDLGVVHPDRPGEYILGVECDGATYHSGRSARDRDRLRQEVLERLGWTIHRVWSTDWFMNREVEIERLAKVLKEEAQKPQLSMEESSTIALRPAIVPPEPESLPREDAGSKSIGYQSRQPAVEKPPQTAGRKGSSRRIEKFVSAPAEQQSSEEVKEKIRRLLVQYRERNIAPNASQRAGGILRKEMLHMFVEKRPTTRQEWLFLFPLSLREKTDREQMKYLEDILDIIEEAAFGA